MMEQMIKGVLKKTITQDYPHLQLPAVVFAMVRSAQKLEETYEVQDLEITNETTGETFQATVKAHWHEYSLQVLDKLGDDSVDFPEIPGVRSQQAIKAGRIVAIGLNQGELNPVLIGEVSL